jgi:hypothetical protein
MKPVDSIVAVYDSHEQAERPVKLLQEAGVNMKTLSIVAKICTRQIRWLAITTLAIE